MTWEGQNYLESVRDNNRHIFATILHINYKCEKIRKKIKRRNLDGNKKNIGKRTKQKRRPGGTGEGSAGEKTEQGIAGQAEPGCRRAGEDDGESGCEMRDVSAEKK